MPFVIPSLTDLVARARAAFNAEMPGVDAWLWPNNIGPTAKVIGGAMSELFGRLDYVNRQARAATAEGEWLDQHGDDLRLPRRPPQAAAGTVTLTTGDALAVIAGAVLKRLDGTAYVVATAATVAAPPPGTTVTATLAVLAAAPGAAGTALPGTPLTFVSGFSGPGLPAATVAVATDGLVGADSEPDGAPYTRDLGTYRGRILFRKAFTPMGGAPSDYVTWAASVPGVTRVYVDRRYAGPGTLRVFPVFDDLFAASGGVADLAHLALVQAAIDAEAPAGCFATAVLPAAQPIDVAVSGLVPNNAGVQEAVRGELRDAVRRLGAAAGTDPATPALQAAMPFLAVPFTFSRSWLWQAAANASGEARHVLAAPAADVAIATAAIPVLGQVTFT